MWFYNPESCVALVERCFPPQGTGQASVLPPHCHVRHLFPILLDVCVTAPSPLFSDNCHQVWQHCVPALVPLTPVLPPPALVCPHRGCLGPRKGKSSSVGTPEHPDWEGDKKGWQKMSLVQRWEVESWTSSCRQLMWVQNASAGFEAAKQPVGQLPVSSSTTALLGTDLSSRLGWMVFLTWTHAPSWLKAKEISVQPQPMIEEPPSLGCPFPLDP